MRVLGNLKEQWSKMTRFFQMISNNIKVQMDCTLKKFLKTAESAQDRNIKGITWSEAMRDLLYTQAFEASKISYQVNTVASVYFEVSSKYLMNNVASLAKLAALDSVDDAAEIKRQQQILEKQSQQCIQSIQGYARETRAKFGLLCEKRISQINNSLKNALPPPSAKIAESNKRLMDNTKKNIQKGFASIDEDEDADHYC